MCLGQQGAFPAGMLIEKVQSAMKDRIAAQVCEMMHGLTVVNMRTMGLVLKTLQESACLVSAAMGKTSSGAPTFPIAGGVRQGTMIQ